LLLRFAQSKQLQQKKKRFNFFQITSPTIAE